MERECQVDWKTLLAYAPCSVDEELLLRNEYLVAENRILRYQIQGRPPIDKDIEALVVEMTKASWS